jgi:phosphatidylserine/phosphatidylglycerophosphate/cardiolipin synthase-like enzyme
MTDALCTLSAQTLTALAERIERGSLSVPYTEMGLNVVDAAVRAAVAADLESLRALAVAPAAIAVFLRALSRQRQHAQHTQQRTELVWTGPDVGGSHTRDAGVIASELFAQAERSVLVATYALHNGRDVLAALAGRMDDVPELDVKLIVNIERHIGDMSERATLVRQFTDRFIQKEWPGQRLPEVYFDPRALLPVGTPGRAVMHAKCVVIDDFWVLVTSANFTEAAQLRNVEAGVKLGNAHLAKGIITQFTTLIARSFERLTLPTSK